MRNKEQKFENGNYSDCDNESESDCEEASDNEIGSPLTKKKSKSSIIDNVKEVLSGKSVTMESSSDSFEEVSPTSMTKKLMSKFFQ